MNIDNLKKEIKTVEYTGGYEEITYRTGELIALCPKTKQASIYDLSIKFTPDTKTPDLDSLKSYMSQYLSIPTRPEHLAHQIYEDFDDVIMPVDLYVVLRAIGRNGINTIVEVGSDF